jgi:hypothetical protein
MTISRQRFGKHRLTAGSESPFASQRFDKHKSPAAPDTLVKVKALPRIDTSFRGNEY